MIRSNVLLVLTTVILPALPAGLAGQDPDPSDALHGAWELVASETLAPDGSVIPGSPRESFVFFTPDGHYSMGWASGSEPSPPYAERFRPTDAEALARYRSLVVNAGSYEVIAGRVEIRPRFALVPEYVGGFGALDWSVEGDRLELVWHTIRSVDGVTDPATAEGYRWRYTLERVR